MGIKKTKDIRYRLFHKSIHSVWLFPVLLTTILLTLTAMKINGSSIGIYSNFFFKDAPDSALIANHPRAIRSDEWVVNTQMAIAQSNDNYNEINKNLGDGADMSLLVDAPYSGISALFKPHNFSFFVLPFDYAFAFKWWFMAYLLILSVYFFILAVLPKRRVLATILALAFFFSPFIQWWYQYITLAPIYSVLFASIAFMHILNTSSMKKRFILSIALTYVLICFALVQYPPFQIPCIIVMTAFLIGYTVEAKKVRGIKLKTPLIATIIACILALTSVGIFIYEKRDAFNTINNTAYPGKRVVESGNYSATHLLASHLSYQFQDDKKASTYSIKNANATNQSESSNFILILPFLLIPILGIMYLYWKKKTTIDYPLLFSSLAFVSIIIWLFVPGLDIIGKISLLDKVPHSRLLIGLGLLNLISIVLFIRLYEKISTVSQRFTIPYTVLLWVLLLAIGYKIHVMFPLFVGFKSIVLLSVVIPVVIYLLLRKHFVLALLLYLLFSIASTAGINPLYRGTDILTNNKLVSAIKSIPSGNNERWVMEDSSLQSFAFMSGKPSLTGVYEYPQLNLWKDLPTDKYTYNRYAHVNFVFDKTTGPATETHAVTPIPDHFAIFTEPCGDLVKSKHITYIVSSAEYTKEIAPCMMLVKEIVYPTSTFHIYKISF